MSNINLFQNGCRYEEKTGQSWDDRATFVQLNGKYDLLKVIVTLLNCVLSAEIISRAYKQVDYSGSVASGRWEYLDGNWKSYDAEASDIVEKVKFIGLFERIL